MPALPQNPRARRARYPELRFEKAVGWNTWLGLFVLVRRIVESREAFLRLLLSNVQSSAKSHYACLANPARHLPSRRLSLARNTRIDTLQNALYRVKLLFREAPFLLPPGAPRNVLFPSRVKT